VTHAVIDTSVFVSAFIGRDDAAPARLLRAARERRFTIVASPQLIQELTQVLDRPKFTAWSANDRASIFVGGIVALSEVHDDPPAPPALTRDSEDDYLVALAYSSDADAIVSVDRDLLEAGLTIRCLTPTDFLVALESPPNAP
jgi:putative PIN family toxin of toxin-antitoxin system